MLGSLFDWLWWVCVILYVPACLGLIFVVLVQKGKGVGFAGAFGLGGGGADTVFGPRMSKSLPVKLTYVMAGMFLLLAMGMSLLSGRISKGQAPELVETETVDMSGYDEGGIGAAPAAAEGEAAGVVPVAPANEGAGAVPSVTVEEAAPEQPAPQTVTVEPPAPVADQSTAETPAGDAGEASPPAANQ
ncbi:MAG TPA: preprotein translocase subunit SecG [Candidatus Hydrogenedentes bacterium]|nr:preprotein translocase subunit SecG [Candidatus Hydrogenedentota bacterium]HQM48286.1 preprotein translocase subunit SecG [Candidatus Hydrogenedentota bacterium]